MCHPQKKPIEVPNKLEQSIAQKNSTRELSRRVWPGPPDSSETHSFGTDWQNKVQVDENNLRANQAPIKFANAEPKTPDICRAPSAKVPTGTEQRESANGTQRGMELRQFQGSAPECRAGTPGQTLARAAIDAARIPGEQTGAIRAPEMKDHLMEPRHVGYGGPPPLSARSAETGNGSATVPSTERVGDRTQLLRSSTPDTAVASGTDSALRHSLLDRGTSQGDSRTPITSESGPTRSAWGYPPPAPRTPGIESGGIPARANSNDTARSAASESAIIPRNVPEAQGNKDLSRVAWNAQTPMRELTTPRVSESPKALSVETAGLRTPYDHSATSRSPESSAAKTPGDPFASSTRADFSQMRTNQPITHNLEQQQGKQSTLAFLGDIRQPFAESTKSAGTNQTGTNPYEGRVPTVDPRGTPETHQPTTNPHLPDGRGITNNPHASDGKGLAEPGSRSDGRGLTEPGNRPDVKDVTNIPHKPNANEATDVTHRSDGKDATSSIHKPDGKDLTNTTTRTEGIDKPSGRPVVGSGRADGTGQTTDGRIGTRVDYGSGRTGDYTGGPKPSDNGVGGGSGGGSASGGRTGDIAVFVPGVLLGTKHGTKAEPDFVVPGKRHGISGGAVESNNGRNDGLIVKDGARLAPGRSGSPGENTGQDRFNLHNAVAIGENSNSWGTKVPERTSGVGGSGGGLMGALRIAAQRIFKADSQRAESPGNPNLPGPRTEQIPMQGDVSGASGVERVRLPADGGTGDTHLITRHVLGTASGGRTSEALAGRTVQIESGQLRTEGAVTGSGPTASVDFDAVETAVDDTLIDVAPITLLDVDTNQTETFRDDQTMAHPESSSGNEHDHMEDDTVVFPALSRQGLFPGNQGAAYYYVAKQGDTVDSVARDVLKDATAGPLLFHMNQQIVVAIFVNARTELFFKVGSVVYLPAPMQIARYKI